MTAKTKTTEIVETDTVVENTLPVAIEDLTPKAGPIVYLATNGLKPYLDHIRTQVTGEVPDLTTAKGRNRIASLAAQVARSKTAIEKPGREYLKELKAQPKLIEKHLREFVQECDQLRDDTRKPLTDWEAEQEAKRVYLQAKVDYFNEEYQAMLEGMPANLHERAEFIQDVLTAIKEEPVGDDFGDLQEQGQQVKQTVIDKMTMAYQAALIESDNQRKADEQAEQDRIAREKQIADEAAAKAKADAEAAAQAKIDAANAAAQKVIDDAAALQRQREQQANIDAANKERADQLVTHLKELSANASRAANVAEAKVCFDVIAQTNIPDSLGGKFDRVLTYYDSIYTAANQRWSELSRIDEQQAQALIDQQEADKKSRNREHQRTVNKAIMQKLMALGASEQLGKAIITAAVNGELGAMAINY